MSPNEEQRPITREDLRQELTQLKSGLQDFVKEFVTDLQTKLKADMQEIVRDAQTEILRAFHSFEKSRELRFARLKAEVSNLDLEANGRIDNIEKRLMAIEEKLILDPPRH
jgi:hypothetical protein